MNRQLLRLCSGVVAAGVITLAAAPVSAATVVSHSGANAVFLSVAGNGQGTGNVTATNDGTNETRTGETTPPISVLKNQSLFNAGVLAQEASASKTGSAACAGLAGSGGSVAQVGDSSCLTPGTPLQATLGSLDLSKLVVADPTSALAPLNQATTPILTNLQPAIDAINSGLAQARAQFGDVGLLAQIGAIEGRCTATTSDQTGSSTLADVGLKVRVPQQGDITLLTLPVNPAPNTHLTTNLSDLLDAVLNAVDADLQQSLNGALGPLQQVTAALRDQVVANIRSQVEKNLAPLEQNLLDITLNQQVRSAGAIKVRALDLKVLPVAQQQLGAPLVNLQVGNAACGPAEAAVVSPPQAAPTPSAPKVPHAVSAGLATAPVASDHGTNPVLFVLMALAGLTIAGTGVAGVRRSR